MFDKKQFIADCLKVSGIVHAIFYGLLACYYVGMFFIIGMDCITDKMNFISEVTNWLDTMFISGSYTGYRWGLRGIAMTEMLAVFTSIITVTILCNRN